MPTIRQIKTKTKGIRWRADVWSGGTRESARFKTKPEAVAWAYKREAELATDRRIIQGQTYAMAMKRYADEVAAKKRGARAEGIRLERLKRQPIASKLLAHLTLTDAEEYRDQRLTEVQPGSVTREMVVMCSVLRKAVKWRWIDVYPWTDLEMPARPRSRTKVYNQDEIDLILETAGVASAEPIVTRIQQAAMAFAFAVETAMRQGEITSLEWPDIDLTKRVASLSMTKNGDPRRVPLSRRAVAIIERLPRHHTRPWPMSSDSLSQHFMRLRKLAGITDGTFHDARRTACTRMAKKLGPMDLAKVSGHRDLKMLLRVYYEPDAADLALLLDD